MRTRLLFILQAILLVCGNTANANAKPQVTIPVNAAYAVDSLWTEEEILRRFQNTQKIYANACPNLVINIELNELVPVRSANLQEIDGHLSKSSVAQMKSILALFKTQVRPTLFYVRRATDEGKSVPGDHMAQAYTFDGPRSLERFVGHAWNGWVFDPKGSFPFAMGNLNWSRFNELKPVHGTSIIAQGYSEKSDFKQGQAQDKTFSVDVHELGHILLNDGSHRYTLNNIMSAEDRLLLDPDQCELVAAYAQQEALRYKSVLRGMRQVCQFGKSTGKLDMPSYCGHHFGKIKTDSADRSASP